MKSAPGATTKERDPSASINGSSGPVLSPIPPAPLVEPAKRRRPIGFLAAAVLLVIAGGMGDNTGTADPLIGADGSRSFVPAPWADFTSPS